MIKTTGKEFKRFYNDDSIWPEGSWYDDAEIISDGVEVDGIHDIPDTAKVVVYGGTVYSGGKEVSLETMFKRWKKKQEVTCLLVECKHSFVSDIIEAILSAGGRVL